MQSSSSQKKINPGKDPEKISIFFRAYRSSFKRMAA